MRGLEKDQDLTSHLGGGKVILHDANTGNKKEKDLEGLEFSGGKLDFGLMKP